MPDGIPPPFLVREATRMHGLERQAGLVVLRPGSVAFLPTGDAKNLAFQLGFALFGLHEVEGRPRTPVTSGWLETDAATLDARIAMEVRKGGVRWMPGDATLAFSPYRKGGVPAAWIRDTDDRIDTTLPPATPQDLLEGWHAWVRPPPNRKDLARSARSFGCLGMVPLVPAGILVWGALTRDPWMWLGVAFWCLLPAVLGFIWLYQLHAYVDHERLSRGLARSTPAPTPAIERWPRIPVAARSAPLEPLPAPRGVSMAARLRGMMGAILDFGVLGVGIGSVSVGIERATGWSFGPVLLLGLPVYHVLCVRVLGATVGQRLFGLQVQRLDGGPRTLPRSALYVLLLWAELGLMIPCAFFAFIGFLWYSRRAGVLPHERLSGMKLDWIGIMGVAPPSA